MMCNVYVCIQLRMYIYIYTFFLTARHKGAVSCGLSVLEFGFQLSA